MLRVKKCEEAVQQEAVCNWCGVVVLPDSGTFEHVAFLGRLFRDGVSGLLALRFVSSSSSELGFEIIFDLLLTRLFLLLERGKVAITCFVLLAFLLL